MPSGPLAEFSFVTLLVLLCVLGLSAGTFWLLARRATSHRRWVALSDWGRARGFNYHPIGEGNLPEPFTGLKDPRPVVRLWLRGKSVDLAQLEQRPGDATAPTWHVLIRQVESVWPPTALQPTSGHNTLLDQFSLASFPSMIASERFVIFGSDSAAARSVAKSSLPALIPPDIGLLLHGRRLVLDFSARPFDTIEFDRMLALANHLTAHLPSLRS